MKACQRVVILGAGFGGLTTATRLAALRGFPTDCEIVLVDKSTHHLYTPLVYEVATGSFVETEDELRGGAAVPWDDLKNQFSRQGIHVVNEEVVGFDAKRSEVLLSDDRSIGYDHLVLALGGVVDFYGIEGLEEHSHNLYSMRQALAIRRHLHDLLIQKRANKIPHVRVLVGGAGPAGVEFACELAGFMRRLTKEKFIHIGDYSIEIVEASNRPLPTFHKSMSEWARTRLESLGVKLLLDTCVKGAHKDHVVLAPRPLKEGERTEDLVCDFRKESHKEVTTDLLVWAGGSRATPLLASLGLNLDRRGRVETDAHLMVRGTTNVWALGDCSSLTDPKTKLGVPPLAQAAITQGRVLAENLMRSVRGEKLISYGFPHMHAIVPMGGTYALAEVFGIRMKGVVAHLLRLAADARYYFSTFPFGEAWKIFRTGARVYGKNN
jgi:NADH dehydrogenase